MGRCPTNFPESLSIRANLLDFFRVKQIRWSGDITVADSAPAVAFVAQQQLSRNRPASSRVRKCGGTAAAAISEVGRCPSDSLPRDPLASSEPIQVSTRFLTVASTVHT
jgi:hypothetical protein